MIGRYDALSTDRDEVIRPAGGIELVEVAGVWWCRYIETEEDGTRGEQLIRLDHVRRLARLADQEVQP